MPTKKAVTIEDLKETHGSRADEVYNRIAAVGGFGSVGNEFYGGKPALDINGCAPEILVEIEKILSEVEMTDEAKKKEGKK